MKQILILLVIILASYGSNIHGDTKYEILSEEVHPLFSKCNMKIRLEKKVDKIILIEIANEIRESRKAFEKLWISFFVGEMNSYSDVWAIANFTPNLLVEIVGPTEVEDRKMEMNSEVDGKLIGKWKEEQVTSGIIIIIYRDNMGLLKLKMIFKDLKEMEKDLVAKTTNGKTRYDYKEYFHGEYFVLEESGNLGMYEDGEKYGEALKIK